MDSIPHGKLITIVEICRKIAARHQVRGCCSLTTGIFITTIANAMEEMKKEGKAGATPYWRTLKADGSLNDKYPGGAAAQKILLANEGFCVGQKGKKIYVADFQKYLFPI
jgi:hypothetical protein